MEQRLELGRHDHIGKEDREKQRHDETPEGPAHLLLLAGVDHLVVGREAELGDDPVDRGTDPADLRAVEVRSYDDLALLVLPADLERSADRLTSHELPERDQRAPVKELLVQEGFDVRAPPGVQAYQDVVSS